MEEASQEACREEAKGVQPEKLPMMRVPMTRVADRR
jgi:hypothetical protein